MSGIRRGLILALATADLLAVEATYVLTALVGVEDEASTTLEMVVVLPGRASRTRRAAATGRPRL